MIHVRTMKMADIPAGEALCRAANWNQLPRDWQLFLELNPAGNRVAELDKNVVGTVTTLDYQDKFSWIGMVLVDPAYRQKGIGTALLKEALAMLSDRETVKLDATPAGREVYLKMDFKDEYRLSRMVGVANPEKLINANSSGIKSENLDTISDFDKKIFGAGRRGLLEWQWKGAHEYAFVEKNGEEIAGYCLGRHGYNFEQIGPVLALNADIAIRLTSAALANCKSKPVAIDAMHFNPEWLSWLTSLGLKEQRPFVRMYKGTNAINDRPAEQFGIMGPEFG